jgi:hypothetical protein
MLYLNPFTSWSSSSNEENFNQLVSFETYQRLVKQEMNELHSLANSSAANAKDHFQQYYHNLNQAESMELKVRSNFNKTLKLILN